MSLPAWSTREGYDDSLFAPSPVMSPDANGGLRAGLGVGNNFPIVAATRRPSDWLGDPPPPVRSGISAHETLLAAIHSAGRGDASLAANPDPAPHAALAAEWSRYADLAIGVGPPLESLAEYGAARASLIAAARVLDSDSAQAPLDLLGAAVQHGHCATGWETLSDRPVPSLRAWSRVIVAGAELLRQNADVAAAHIAALTPAERSSLMMGPSDGLQRVEQAIHGALREQAETQPSAELLVFEAGAGADAASLLRTAKSAVREDNIGLLLGAVEHRNAERDVVDLAMEHAGDDPQVWRAVLGRRDSSPSVIDDVVSKAMSPGTTDVGSMVLALWHPNTEYALRGWIARNGGPAIESIAMDAWVFLVGALRPRDLARNQATTSAPATRQRGDAGFLK